MKKGGVSWASRGPLLPSRGPSWGSFEPFQGPRGSPRGSCGPSWGSFEHSLPSRGLGWALFESFWTAEDPAWGSFAYFWGARKQISHARLEVGEDTDLDMASFLTFCPFSYGKCAVANTSKIRLCHKLFIFKQLQPGAFFDKENYPPNPPNRCSGTYLRSLSVT